ncbi:MAG: type II CRISPR RNA-guided endonuclease Cas9 [Saccharofermentanales bacterium]
MNNETIHSQNLLNSEKKEETRRPYYLGLDMGTSSLGFAVTDRHYNVIRKRGRHLWGIRLFEEAKTSATTRQYRTARRRRKREKERVRFIQEVFRSALEEKDPGFLQRLDDSFFYPEDKRTEQKYSLFNDDNFNDSDYHKRFPTIYHLRNHLIKSDSEQDVRFVYLAILHIMKNRGHFLYPGGEYNPDEQYDTCYASFAEACSTLLGDAVFPDVENELREVLVRTDISRTGKHKQILTVLENGGYDLSKKQRSELAKLLAGLKCSFQTLFDDEELEEAETKQCELAKDYDAVRPSIEESIGTERIELIDSAYSLFNWMRLSAILGEHDLLSEAKVAVFEKHKYDLRWLKDVVKSLIVIDQEAIRATAKSENDLKKPHIYARIFNTSKKNLTNYVAYSGHFSKRGKKRELEFRNRTQSDFLAFLKKELDPYKEIAQVEDLIKEIEKGDFLPLIVGTDNGTIPRQIVGAELRIILKNTSRYLKFLDKEVCDKIQQVFEFRVPYYVGPLNPAHRFDKDEGRYAWVVRKERGKVYPWNIREKVDLEKSAEIFIERMTRDCSCLSGEKAMPKQSLLYTEYMMLNIVNAINIKGVRLDNNTRQQLIQDLFMDSEAPRRVTRKRVHNWLKSRGYQFNDADLGGFDLDIPVHLTALHDYRKLTSSDIDMNDMENIVRIITLFPDDSAMIRRRLKSDYGDSITEEDLKFLSSRRYRDWGRLSEKLLTGIKGVAANDYNRSIIDMMREEPLLLGELLSSNYSFSDQIKEHNKAKAPPSLGISHTLLDDYMASPAVKRMIWQTLLVYKDIERIMKDPPEKIFVEVARDDLDPKERTRSRKRQLKDLYATCRRDTDEWGLVLGESLEREEEKALDSRRLFLYYLQQGRCAYSDELITIETLYTNRYDIDHIYPRSLTKDDSIHNNLVLVKSELNRAKGDRPLVPREYQERAGRLWKRLLKQGFMTQEKYRRLTRTTPLTDIELTGFINRQLVETRQSIKIVTDILERILGDQTRLVYVKAGHVRDFRYRDFRSSVDDPDREDIEFVKCREINDIHHAKDAYLNIVVGNVLDEKFTKDPLQYLSSARKDKYQNKYNLARLYDFDLPYRKKNLGLAWKAGKEGTIATVKKVMARNDILYTEQAIIKTGELFDLQLKKASRIVTLEGKMPIKSSSPTRKQGMTNPYLNIKRYGAYDHINIAHYALIEAESNERAERIIEPVPTWLYYKSMKAKMDRNALYQEYFNSQYNDEKIRVIIPMIPFNSVFRINNYCCRIRGKSEGYYFLESHIQPFFSPSNERVLSQVANCLKLTTYDEYLGLSKEEQLEIDRKFLDRLLDIDLEELLKYLVLRIETGPWKHSPQIQSLVADIKTRIASIEESSIVVLSYCIMQLLPVMNCHLQSFDLSCFGLGTRVGSRRISKKLKKNVKYQWITQSPSGFYENAIDLWE